MTDNNQLAAMEAALDAAARERDALRERLLAFMAWRDRVQEHDGIHYLNGESPPFGNGDDAWNDLDALADLARTTLEGTDRD